MKSSRRLSVVAGAVHQLQACIECEQRVLATAVKGLSHRHYTTLNRSPFERVDLRILIDAYCSRKDEMMEPIRDHPLSYRAREAIQELHKIHRVVDRRPKHGNTFGGRPAGSDRPKDFGTLITSLSVCTKSEPCVFLMNSMCYNILHAYLKA